MHPVQLAAQALSEHYGPEPLPGEPGEWPTLVKLIVGKGLSPDRLEQIWRTLAESPLSSARETDACGVAEIREILDGLGRSAPSAPILKALATWWIARVDGDSQLSLDPDGLRGIFLEKLRGQLRRIQGLGLEQADRILLFVAGLAVYPIGRSSVRIACRHGWLGLEAEYEEWQSFFVRGLSDSRLELTQLSLWSARVGKDFCGPKPKCEQCPLKSLLPAGGPCEMDES